LSPPESGVEVSRSDGVGGFDGWSEDRVLRWLLLAGLAVRVVFTLWTDPVNRLLADDLIYTQQAKLWRESGVLETGYLERPPLYFAFLYLTSALWFGPIGWTLLSKLVQCLAGAAIAIPVYALADRVAGPRAGRIAAAFVLFEPTMVAYCAILWPETLYALFTAIVFWRATLLAPSLWVRPILLGVLTGLAMLLKPAFGAFTVLLALHWWKQFGFRGAVRLSLVFGIATAVVLAPWVVRNQIRYGPEILLENEGPYNLWMSSHPGEPIEVFRAWHALPDPLTRARVASEKGWEGIRNDPAEYLRRTAVRAVNLWGLEYFVVRNLTLEGFGAIGVGTFLFWFWVIQLGYVALLVAAAAGVRRLWQDPQTRLLLVWTLVFTAISAGLVATTRFRMPFEIILAIAAGVGLTGALEGRLRRTDLAAIGCAVLLLALSFQRPMFRLIASGGLETLDQLRVSRWIYFWY